MTTPNPIDATPAAATVYVLDPGVSRFTARAFATGLLASLGHNPSFAIRQFAGEAKFSAEAPEQSSLRVVVQSASLELSDQVSDKDRREIERAMRNEVLETDQVSRNCLRSLQPFPVEGWRDALLGKP